MGNGRDLSRFSEEGEANKIFADSASQTLFEHIRNPIPENEARSASPSCHVCRAKESIDLWYVENPREGPDENMARRQQGSRRRPSLNRERDNSPLIGWRWSVATREWDLRSKR